MTKRTVLVGLLLLATPALAEEVAQSGRAAPMFRLPVYNAKVVGQSVVGLDKYVGSDPADKEAKVVLLSFMASFCAPCKKEMPWLQQLSEKYKAQGLRVVMVSIDTEPEGQKQIDELIEKNKVTFPVLKDRFNLVARRWLGLKSPLPSVFLVKPDGTVHTAHRGYTDDIARSLEAEVAQALEAGKSVAATGTP